MGVGAGVLMGVGVRVCDGVVDGVKDNGEGGGV